MKYKFFTNSYHSWKAMYREIQEARTSVYLEMYIFENTVENFDFFKLLQDKARDGIKVKLILDSFGSKELTQASVSELRSNGVEVLFVSFLFHRMHRKVLIVDESVAFVGGVNIHNTAKFWNDLVLMIKGELVPKVVRSFASSYRNAKGTDKSILQKLKNKKVNKLKSWLIEHSPSNKIFSLKKIYKENLNKTEKSIVLVTPYFAPKRWLVALLHQAVLRGVRVEVLIPKNTDHPFFLDRVNYYYVNKLKKLGVEFYLHPKMNHAKLTVFDKEEAIVGSNNIDVLSFDLNSEVGVFLKEKEAVANLLDVVENWKKESKVFDLNRYKIKWFDYILSPLISVFYRVF
ncbi:MAG: phosphatidylserine/phosphatidylglycerophosphate/cardiolipin synthase family protein [Candidatus Paceibacterota bacterium]